MVASRSGKRTRALQTELKTETDRLEKGLAEREKHAVEVKTQREKLKAIADRLKLRGKEFKAAEDLHAQLNGEKVSFLSSLTLEESSRLFRFPTGRLYLLILVATSQ